MNLEKHPDFQYRFLASLLPSFLSGVLCVITAISIVSIHAIYDSLSLGTSLPDIFNGEWGIAYTNYVVGPLLSVFNNLTVNKFLILMLWGTVGYLVYVLFEFLVHGYQNFYRAEHDVGMVGQYTVQHPARRQYFITVLWRFGVTIGFMVIFIFCIPVPFREMARIMPDIVLGKMSGATLLPITFELFLLCHLVVVFFRLFKGRVRLFDADPV